MLHIGDGDGKEKIHIEFKKFIIQPTLLKYISNVDVERYIESCIIDDGLNDIFMKNIKIYIAKYFPKYFSTMSRTEYLTAKSCKFYIGIDDDGTISGIPLKRNLTAESVRSLILKTIPKIRGISDGIVSSDVLESYLSEVSVKIIQCDTPDRANLDEIVSKIRIKQDNIEKKFMKYYNKLDKWKRKLAIYNVSLECISNERTRRAEFLEFCRINDAPIHILTLLESDEIISISDGVRDRKTDISSFEYYVTEFKDRKINELIATKPKKPCINRADNLLSFEFSMLNMMIGNWTNANYYVIEIELPFNKNPYEWIEHMEGREWVSRMRDITSYGEPFCTKL